MQHWLERLSRGFAALGALVALGVAGMTVVSIAGRSLWSRPIPGDVELTQFGIALCISLCLPWAQVRRANIVVDFFTQRLSGRSTQRLDAVGAALLGAMCLLLAWRSAVGAMSVAEAGEASMILDLPMWWVYASLVPGLALSGLVALVQAAQLARGAPVGGADAGLPS
ncbi:MAG: TRAP transporter small permease [Burkholderiaceae bacterium]|nr:TRAP transporter small permease [Burkholderiaceae bacterium]